MAIAETAHAGEWLLKKDGYRSCEEIVVNSGQDLVAGTVLGRLMSAAAVADGGNTGDGTVSAVTIGKGCQPGDYILTCIEEVVDAGFFQVIGPDGRALARLEVGVAYDSQIGLTVADGASDWDVGDFITVTVTEGNWEQLDEAEDDGAQNAAGILWAAVDASAADAPGAALVRDGEVVDGELTWPTGISAGDKAVAEAELTALGIIIR